MGEYTDRLKKQEQDAQNNDVLKYLYPISAGLGAVALGSYIYGSVFKGHGGNAVSNLLHFLGRPGQLGVNVEKLANSGAAEAGSRTGLRGWLTSTFNISLGKVQLGPIDIVGDLTNAIDIIGSTKGPVRDKIASRVTEYINRKYTNSGVGSSFFSQNLERITVDQVLGNKGEWSRIIGGNQWEVINQAKTLGLVTKDTILDKGIYKTNKGFLRDNRLRSLFLYGDKEGNLKSKVDLFGQWNVIKSWIGSNTGIAKLNNFTGVKGKSFFIDGNVFAYTKSAEGITENVVGRGLKLREFGDRLSVIRHVKEGNLQPVVKTRTGFFGGLLSKLEEKTGIGTSYQNRYSFYQRFITNPLKRLAAITSGKAVVRESAVEESSGFTLFLDDLYGAHYPEIVSSRPKRDIIAKGVVDYRKLPVSQKLALLFDRTSKYTLVSTDSSGRIENLIKNKITPKILDTDLYTKPPPGGGYKVTGKKGKFYTAPKSRIIPGVTSSSDMANYMIYRISHLASESLLGISFYPSNNLLGNAMKLAAIPLVYEGMRQAYNYADYISEKYTGISPTKTLATAYTKARIAQQKIREYTGIQQGLDYAEKQFPGIVNSELFGIGRSVIAPGLAFGILSKASISAGIIGAAATYAAIGGAEPNQTSEDLQREYAGDKKVAIRKGRFWGIGTQPFGGGEIERYDYSWYHKLTHSPETKSLYGSKDEYWKYHANVFGIPFPTPSNLFGINNITNPYRLEQINKNTRPYEATGSPLEEFPIFGPILGPTIGRVFKPTLYRAGLVPEGLTTTTARDLGMPDIVASRDFNDTLLDRMKKIGNVALEPLGLYKFVLEYFGVNFEPTTEQMASSEIMQSSARRFYGMSLGGALGETEFIRRFLLSDYGTPANISRMINRVPNSMPNWLPGTGSSFKRDQSYYIDYHLGDPYSKLAAGSWRLPGRGYESVAQLESETPGEYSAVDRLLILCVPPDTKIMTPSGIKEIKDFDIENDKVIGSDGKWNKAIVIKQEKECKKIKITQYYDMAYPIECMENHKILTDSGYKISKNITKEDYVFYPFRTSDEQADVINGEVCFQAYKANLNIIVENNKLYALAKGSHKQNKVYNQLNLDKEFGRIIGLFLAEGSVSESTLYFSFHSSELHLRDEIIGWVSKVSPDTKTLWEEKGNSARLTIYNKSLCLIFTHLCNKGSEKKKLNDLFFGKNIPKDFIKGIIGGWFDGDGYCGSNSRNSGIVTSATTISKNLAIDIRHLAMKVNILLSIREIDRRGKHTSKNEINYKIINKSWLLSIVSDFLIEMRPFFRKLDKFINENTRAVYKNRNIKFTDNGVYIKIRNLEISDYKGIVYDLHVSDISSFCTPTFCTHNSDVAPWSEAYRHYERIVSKMNLSPEWRRKVEEAKIQKDKMISIEDRYPRYTDSLISLNEHIHDSAAHRQARGLYDMFTHDFLAEIPVLGSKLAPFRDPYEKYRKMYIEGSEFASWYTPWEDIQRPALYDVALSNPLMGAVKGGVIGGLLSSSFMSWASPIAIAPVKSLLGGAILGGGLATARIAAGVPDNYVPQHVRQQSDVFNYLDSLTYIKNRGLETLASDRGADSSQFAKERRKTMVGARSPMLVRASLPTSTDKRYFDIFLNTPAANRDKILAGVSPYMAEALTKVWNKDYNSTEQADYEAYQNVQNLGLPAMNSLAWHPSVDTDSMQLKLIMHGLGGVSDNYHRYGFFESHEATLRTRFPDLWNETTTFTPPPNYFNGTEFMRSIGQNIYDSQSSYSTIATTPYGARYTKRLQIDRGNDVMNVARGRY